MSNEIKWPGEAGFIRLAPEKAAGPAQDPSSSLSSGDILRRALKHQEDRAATYDKPGGERSMAATVKAFNAIVGRSALSESDGWLLLTLLKMVRDQANGPHRDSIEDGVSYFSLYGEARLK